MKKKCVGKFYLTCVLQLNVKVCPCLSEHLEKLYAGSAIQCLRYTASVDFLKFTSNEIKYAAVTTYVSKYSSKEIVSIQLF